MGTDIWFSVEKQGADGKWQDIKVSKGWYSSRNYATAISENCHQPTDTKEQTK
ncbi:MAG: hypothetical protein ABSA65_18070 [Acidimicrobiales bacterium]